MRVWVGCSYLVVFFSSTTLLGLVLQTTNFANLIFRFHLWYWENFMFVNQKKNHQNFSCKYLYLCYWSCSSTYVHSVCAVQCELMCGNGFVLLSHHLTVPPLLSQRIIHTFTQNHLFHIYLFICGCWCGHEFGGDRFVNAPRIQIYIVQHWCGCRLGYVLLKEDYQWWCKWYLDLDSKSCGLWMKC